MPLVFLCCRLLPFLRHSLKAFWHFLGNTYLMYSIYNPACISSPRLTSVDLFIMAASPNQCHFELENQDEEAMKRRYENYKEVMSELPKEKGWMMEYMCLYQGFWYHPIHGVGVMSVQQHFKAQPTDIFLITTPKSGTIWLKALIFAIMNRNQYENSTHPLLNINPHECIPFLEHQLYRDLPIPDVESFQPPRLFATHIPYSSLPESIVSSGCRIVYACRNPKDVFVSMWHFMGKLRAKEAKELPPLSLEKAFDMFSRGVTEFGPIWDHVLGYWKASLESPEKVLFLKYEDIRGDTVVYAKELAEFLGSPFSLEEEEGGNVQQIIKLCSFENLSNLEVNKSGRLQVGVENKTFFRQGKVGDWANHLTDEMAEKFDQIIQEKLAPIF